MNNSEKEELESYDPEVLKLLKKSGWSSTSERLIHEGSEELFEFARIFFSKYGGLEFPGKLWIWSGPPNGSHVTMNIKHLMFFFLSGRGNLLL